MSLSIDLSGKRALVTGAAHGIGRGCAIALGQAGADLVLNDLPSERQALWSTAQTAGGTPRLIEKDMFVDEYREPLVAAAGPIDILVSCPYRSTRKPFLELMLGDLRQVIDATFTSHAHLARLVAKRMATTGRPGSIIFIGSIYGIANRAGSAAYDSSKAALHQLARVMARELAPRIRVNCIAPGYTDTPGERKLASEAVIQAAAKALPFGELCQPADIGHMAAFLASDTLARMVTGQVIVVDGLMSLCDFSYGFKLQEE